MVVFNKKARPAVIFMEDFVIGVIHEIRPSESDPTNRRDILVRTEAFGNAFWIENMDKDKIKIVPPDSNVKNSRDKYIVAASATGTNHGIKWLYKELVDHNQMLKQENEFLSMAYADLYHKLRVSADGDLLQEQMLKHTNAVRKMRKDLFNLFESSGGGDALGGLGGMMPPG